MSFFTLPVSQPAAQPVHLETRQSSLQAVRPSTSQFAPPPSQQPSADLAIDTMKTPISIPADAGGTDETNETSAPAGQSGPVESGALPRREPVSLRSKPTEPEAAVGPQIVEASPEDQSAARHSFADDLDAFSLGS